MAILGKYKEKVKGTSFLGRGTGDVEGLKRSLTNSSNVVVIQSSDYERQSDKEEEIASSKESQNEFLRASVSTTDSTIRTSNSSPATDRSIIIIDDETLEEQEMYSRNRSRHYSISSQSIVSAKSAAPTIGKNSEHDNPILRAMNRSPDRSRVSRDPTSATPNMNKRASIYSIASISEHERAQLLRDEITRESLSLQRLEQLAQDLPRISSSSLKNQYNYSTEHLSGKYGDDLQPTSKVIERLQSGMDNLRRELKEQQDIAREERQGRETMRKLVEKSQSKFEGIARQIGNLNGIVDRKQRKIDELEAKLKDKDHTIQSMIEAQQKKMSSQQYYERKITEAEEEKMRMENAYKAVLESSQRMKIKYSNDLLVIGDRISSIQGDRNSDREKLKKLMSQLGSQSKEKEQLIYLQHQTSELRKKHIQQLDGMFESIKATVSDSDKSMTKRVKNTLILINQLEQQYIQLGGDRKKVIDNQKFKR